MIINSFYYFTKNLGIEVESITNNPLVYINGNIGNKWEPLHKLGKDNEIYAPDTPNGTIYDYTTAVRITKSIIDNVFSNDKYNYKHFFTINYNYFLDKIVPSLGSLVEKKKSEPNCRSQSTSSSYTKSWYLCIYNYTSDFTKLKGDVAHLFKLIDDKIRNWYKNDDYVKKAITKCYSAGKNGTIRYVGKPIF